MTPEEEKAKRAEQARNRRANMTPEQRAAYLESRKQEHEKNKEKRATENMTEEQKEAQRAKWCEAARQRRAKMTEEDLERRRERDRNHHQENKEKRNNQQKAYYQANKEVIKERNNQYYHEHKEEQKANRTPEQIERKREMASQWWHANKDRIGDGRNLQKKEYYEANQERLKEKQRDYYWEVERDQEIQSRIELRKHAAEMAGVDLDDSLSIKAAAALYGVAYPTFYSWVMKGFIPHHHWPWGDDYVLKSEIEAVFEGKYDG
jgi:hypothetical protein